MASLVTELATAGEETATGIIEEASDELADAVACVAGRLSLGSAFPLALAGGVACNCDLLRRRIEVSLQARGLVPHAVEIVPRPVAGCLRLAQRSLEKYRVRRRADESP
jgi:hypothetical protein